jgi:Tol biopolymer transport system component/tRNA A-37 threonylcarbamoyl transferase component Bud32
MERELGAGGMATVYLAHDLKHDRKVAVKVLRPELAAVIGAERFLAEIKTTANLQHPHILPLFDSGVADSFLFYVMPFIDGVSLRDRIAREHQLPVNDAVRIASEVASALDYAHRHGVIHRDIKPENILLHDGSALVADFGIALAVSTADTRMTETGMSLGTPHYMSPEQAMGEREITARSDVYALGCITYEMLVGEPPFTGPTAQAIIARVMTEEPRSLTLQRKNVPAHVEDAVFTALEKLPADRFATAAEFGAALAGNAVNAPQRTMRTSRPTRAGSGMNRREVMMRWTWIPAGVLGLLAGLLLWHRGTVAETPLSASLMPPAAGCDFADLGTSNLIQLSPDGSTIAFVARCDGVNAIWIRAMATGIAKVLAGTTNAIYPFWAPDGQSLGFFADARLKRIDLSTGTIRDLAPAQAGRGGTWNRDGVIIYAPDVFSALFRVSATGGDAKALTTIPKGDEVTQRLPYFLPDGRHYLFVEGVGNTYQGKVLVGDLSSTSTRELMNTPSNTIFADGQLFYAHDGALFAQPFSPGSATFTGPAVAVVPGVETWPFKFLGSFSVAGGLLVYRAPRDHEQQMDWFEPATRALTQIVPSGPYLFARLSPDGQRILINRNGEDTPFSDAWIYDVKAESWTRLTTKPELSYSLAWSPDGTQIAVKGATDSVTHILGADRREVASYIGPGPGTGPIEDWAPNGSFALGTRQVAATGTDLTRLVLGAPTAKPELLYGTAADEQGPRISPTGTLVAYRSNQGGRQEVYLTTLPDAKVQWPVSQDGAFFENASPADALAWSRDGHTLYFVDATQHLMAVAITVAPQVSIGRPVRIAGAPDGIVGVSTAPDGRLLLLHNAQRNPVPLTVIANWRSMLGRR